MCIVGSAIFCFLKKPKKTNTEAVMEGGEHDLHGITNPGTEGRLLSDERDKELAGVLDDEEESKPDPIQDIKDTFNMLKSGRMLYCMPMIIWSAWSVNVFAAVFVVLNTRCMTNSYPTCKSEPDNPNCWSDDDRNATALFIMCLLGIGEILGGGVLGKIRDSGGNKLAFTVLILETWVAVGLVIAVNI